MSDPVNPPHYRNDSSGLECIQLAEHFNSGLLQQAYQYVWRCDAKNGDEDLKKALWFLGRESDFRNKHKLGRPRGHLDEGEELFVEWRAKVRSDLRAAALALLWHLDANPRRNHLDFYAVAEVITALMEGKR